MAIQWGGFHGHLRLGLEVWTDGYTWNTPSINVYIATYVQVDSVWNFNDNQTVTLTGSIGATYNFLNNMQANQVRHLGTAIIPNQGQNPNGGPTYNFHAQLSGAYNGAAPSVATSFWLPPRPPPPNSPPYPPTLVSPAASAVVDSANNAVTFSWVFSDPDGGGPTGYVLRARNPAGTWYRWDGTNFIVDNGGTAVLNGATSVTIPAGKIANSGLWQWTVHVRDNAGLWSAEPAPRNLYTSTPPSAVVTEPTGTITSPRPPVKWTYSDPEGTPQNGWQAQVVKASVYSAAGYNPESWTGQTWGFSGSGTASQATPDIDLPNHTTMRAYVKVNSSPNPSGGLQYSSWVYKQFDLHVPPYASSITYPQNGAIVDLLSGFTMTWSNSFYVGTGGVSSSQAAFAIRRKQGTAAYEWWNGISWQNTEHFLSGTNPSYAFRPGEVANGVSWTFSVAIRDGYGGQSAYSSGVSVLGSTAAQVTVTAPPNIVTITNPLIQWSMFDAENDPQQTYQIRVIERGVYESGIPDPLVAAAVWDTGEVVDATTRAVEVPVDLENGNEYRAYVRVKTTGVYSGWSYAQFVVSLQPPAQAWLALTVLDDQGAVQIDIQGRDSMLSTDTGRSFSGWTAGSNATVVGPQQDFSAAQSNYAMRFDSQGLGDFSIRTSTGIDVAPNTLYTAAASLDAAGTQRSFRVEIQWIDDSSTVVASTFGDVVSDPSMNRGFAAGSPPVEATQARIAVVVFGATAAGETYDLYDPVLRPGEGNEWSPGGLLGTTSVSIVAQNPYRIVRHGLNIPMPMETQRVTILDEEVPSGKEQIYGAITRAVYPNAILASATMLTDPVTWTPSFLWLSDPLRPGTSKAWGQQSFGTVNRPVRQGKFRPIGRPDAVLTTGIRALREGSFTIVTNTRAEREAYDDLVDRSEVVLMRIPPDQGETEGETIYIKFEGDAPQARLLPSRTPHRGIEQRWVEQRRPVEQLDFNDSLVVTEEGLNVFLGLDSDGTPYFDSNLPVDQSAVAMGLDSDGVIFFTNFSE